MFVKPYNSTMRGMTVLYGKAELVVHLLIIEMIGCVFSLVHKFYLPFRLEIFKTFN